MVQWFGVMMGFVFLFPEGVVFISICSCFILCSSFYHICWFSLHFCFFFGCWGYLKNGGAADDTLEAAERAISREIICRHRRWPMTEFCVAANISHGKSINYMQSSTIYGVWLISDEHVDVHWGILSKNILPIACGGVWYWGCWSWIQKPLDVDMRSGSGVIPMTCI